MDASTSWMKQLHMKQGCVILGVMRSIPMGRFFTCLMKPRNRFRCRSFRVWNLFLNIHMFCSHVKIRPFPHWVSVKQGWINAGGVVFNPNGKVFPVLKKRNRDRFYFKSGSFYKLFQISAPFCLISFSVKHLAKAEKYLHSKVQLKLPILLTF